MDEIKKQLKNVSLYDVKAYVRKAQNVVYNYTEMEAKVREATNNEPWGASSTLMQQIAAGTYNYREREEIIGMIFRRFTEKAANEWRQIYKALQLLEYLIKNGSERFVDDARANVSLITMLKSFHYIDSQGRDQGINVRTKSKALTELLNNDSQLRQDRKKARENAKKFQGSAGGTASASVGSASQYDEYGTYEGRIFGDGGVYGQRFEETRAAGKKDYEEYDVDGDSSSSATPAPANPSRTNRRVASSSKPVPAKPVEVDLFSFDEPTSTSAQAPQSTQATNNDDFDEFGDFQSSVQPTTTTTPITNNLSSLYNQQPATNTTAAADNSFGDFTSFSSGPTQTSSFSSGPAAAPAKQDAFSSLFSTAATKAHEKKPSLTSSAPAPSPAAKPSSSTSTPANNGGEINLLDF